VSVQSLRSPAPVSADASADPGADPVPATFERVFVLLRRSLPPDGLSLTAASTLHRLELSGPCRLTELSVLEGVTQPGMTQLVSRLERSGLTARSADPQDGRVVLVRITPAGVDVLRHRRAARAARLATMLAALTESERALISAALPALDRLAELIPTTP
jgi:DNA-binding MarR family transcriptional regulator